jgi:hypothetical protein
MQVSHRRASCVAIGQGDHRLPGDGRRVGQRTSLLDLARMWPLEAGSLTELPVDQAADVPLAVTTDETMRTLGALGFAPGVCQPGKR